MCKDNEHFKLCGILLSSCFTLEARLLKKKIIRVFQFAYKYDLLSFHVRYILYVHHLTIKTIVKIIIIWLFLQVTPQQVGLNTTSTSSLVLTPTMKSLGGGGSAVITPTNQHQLSASRQQSTPNLAKLLQDTNTTYSVEDKVGFKYCQVLNTFNNQLKSIILRECNVYRNICQDLC